MDEQRAIAPRLLESLLAQCIPFAVFSVTIESENQLRFNTKLLDWTELPKEKVDEFMDRALENYSAFFNVRMKANTNYEFGTAQGERL